MSESKEFRRILSELSASAAETMRENFALAMKKEWKSDGSPLTVTDTAINERVIEVISRAFPEHRILGEEGSFGPLDAEYVWVCDPVDGTIPFSHGIPTSVFSLALCRNGEPVLGVLHDPFLRREIFAEKGRGATLNGSPLRMIPRSGFQGAIIGVEGPRGTRVSAYGLGKRIEEELECYAISLRCFCYEAMLVASGELAACLFVGTSPWDGAAVKIICEEAGGVVTDLQGREQRYDREIDGIICSPQELHPMLEQLVMREEGRIS